VNGTLRAVPSLQSPSLPVEQTNSCIVILFYSHNSIFGHHLLFNLCYFAFILFTNTFSSPRLAPLTGPLIICFFNFLSSPHSFAGYEVLHFRSSDSRYSPLLPLRSTDSTITISQCGHQVCYGQYCWSRVQSLSLLTPPQRVSTSVSREQVAVVGVGVLTQCCTIDSIKSAASTVAHGLLTFYNGNETVRRILLGALRSWN
jgi:hypothetical protein